MWETIIVGCGPYGLAAAAYLRSSGVETRIFGEPMSFWKQHTPSGMKLRSSLVASDIAAPDPQLAFAEYLRTRGHLGNENEPLPVDSFIEYGKWIQAQVAPDVDKRRISKIIPQGDGFTVVAADGEPMRARRVVIATGIADFAHRLGAFCDAPRALVSHSIEPLELDHFRGRPVAVIGSGQSAFEHAALLSEHGAEVEVIMRARGIRWLRGGAAIRSKLGLVGRILFPWTDIGTPPLNQIVAHPNLLRMLSPRTRRAIDQRVMRASVAGWLKARIQNVKLTTSRKVAMAQREGERLRLVLDDASSRVVDHVVLATGFRVNIARLSFLGPELIARLKQSHGYPDLNGNFESSVRGLHFIGASAAYNFGSLTRFVAGTRFCASTLAAAIAAPSIIPQVSLAKEILSN
jgi:lysine/ornithine N-monooxygenase